MATTVGLVAPSGRDLGHGLAGTGAGEQLLREAPRLSGRSVHVVRGAPGAPVGDEDVKDIDPLGLYPSIAAVNTMRSRFETTTPFGSSTVTAKSDGSNTGSLASIGMMMSPVAASMSNTPPSTG